MRTVGLYLVLLLAVLVPYARMLDAPLIWDDRVLVLEAFDDIKPASPASYFREPFWQNRGSGEQQAYYRPLTRLSLALDHTLHGKNPAGYHLSNVLLHAVNALLLLALLLRNRAQASWAVLLSAAWALSPRLTEAAAWVSGRTDVLAGTCCLLALLVHRPGHRWRGWLGAGFVLLGLFSKEVALAGWAALLLRELVHRRTATDERGTSLRSALPLLLALGCYLALRRSALAGTATFSPELSFGQHVLAIGEALGRYSGDVLLPWLPKTQQGELGQPSLGFVAVGVVTLTVGLLAAWKLRRSSAAGVGEASSTLDGVVLGVVSLGLVLHFIQLPIEVVAYDRFLYFPLLGLALTLGQPLARWSARLRLAPLLAGGFVASLAIATVMRLQDWQSELRFWRAAYEATPHSNGRPGNELGGLFFRAGLFEMAAPIYERVAREARLPTIARGNLGNSWAQLGRTAQASALLGRLCAQQRQVAKYCLDYALSSLQELKLEQARTAAREAERRSPGSLVTSQVLQAIAEVERFRNAPELTSADPARRLAASFRLAKKAGQRTRALELGEALLAQPSAARELSQEAAEFCVRFAPPSDLLRVAKLAAQRGVLSDALSAAASLRIDDSRALVEAWPSLGFGASL